MPISQEKRSREMRIKIYKDIFSKMEKGFEDLLLPEYGEVKNAILNLIDKDPDKLRKVMYTISNMTIEDMYEYIIGLEKTRKQEYKANNMAKSLEKIRKRREDINKDIQDHEENKEEQQTSTENTGEKSKNSQQLDEAREDLEREVSRIKSEFMQEHGFAPTCRYFNYEILQYLYSDNVTIEEVTLYKENIKNKTLLDIYKEKLDEIKEIIELASDEEKEVLKEYKIDTEKCIEVMEETVQRHNKEEHSNSQTQQTINEKEKRKLEKELKSMFRHKEERFEDLLVYANEYKYFKRDMFELLDKDLDGLKKVMNEMHDMTLSDIYTKMLEASRKSGQEDKAKYISETLKKIKQRDTEIEKEAKEQAKKEEELRNYRSKDKKDSKDKREKKDGKDKTDKKDGKDNKGKKPYEKTTITVDASHSKIVICPRGGTKSYEVHNRKDITSFIKNGKEYKNMKETMKNGKKIRVFDKKAVRRADPAILGILIDAGNMDAAKEYVNAFKDENATSIDLKYTFGDYYDATVPMKTISNYEKFAKKVQKSGVAIVEEPEKEKGPIGRFIDRRKANKIKKLEAAREYEESKEIETNKKEQESKDKNNFKDEMKKDAPSPEEQAETVKKFEEQESKKAQKRERKAKKTKTAEAVK